MIKSAAKSFFELAAARHVQCQLESAHHSELWYNLDALFAVPRRIDPCVKQLAESLRSYEVAAVCGPLLGGAFLAQLVAHALDVDFCFTERVMPPHASGLYQARYLLPQAFSARVRGRRIAMVDDVMSAGSALRGTFTELQTHGAEPVVAGALMVLGTTGADFFAEQQVAVEAGGRGGLSPLLPSHGPLW